MGRSPGFASTTNDIFALLRLGFPMAPARKALTVPQTVTRRIIMQKARRHPNHSEESFKLRPLVGAWFQVLLLP